jgi:hypothetical protein
MALKDLLDITGKEKKRKQKVKTAKMIALGVGVAAVTAAAGVATGILIAPKSGKETWEDIRQTCKKCTIQQQPCSPAAESHSTESCDCNGTEKV